MRLAPEGDPQLVQTVFGLLAKRPPITGVSGQAGVDDVRIVVVIEFNHHVLCPIQFHQNVFGIRGHQVCEVWRTKGCRQPQVDLDVIAGDHSASGRTPVR